MQELYPETPIPLDHKDAYTLLIAVLLSAQCTDARVNTVTPALFKLADNPYDMAKVPVEKIQEIIRPCGLSPQKSKAISALSQILVNEHAGKVPDDWEALERLPGVGHKTASVVMSQAFGPSCVSGGYAYSSASATLGFNQRTECGANGKRLKTFISQRKLECLALANNLLWPRTLFSSRLRRYCLRDLHNDLSKQKETQDCIETLRHDDFIRH